VVHVPKKAIVAQNMRLGSEDGIKFWPVYEQYQTALNLINDRTIALIQNYAKNYEVLSDEQAAVLLEEYLEIEKDKLSLKSDFLTRFDEVLTPKQVARFYQIENKFESIKRFEMVKAIPLVDTSETQSLLAQR